MQSATRPPGGLAQATSVTPDRAWSLGHCHCVVGLWGRTHLPAGPGVPTGPFDGRIQVTCRLGGHKVSSAQHTAQSPVTQESCEALVTLRGDLDNSLSHFPMELSRGTACVT